MPKVEIVGATDEVIDALESLNERLTRVERRLEKLWQLAEDEGALELEVTDVDEA